MRIGIDTGGTFTDCVYLRDGELHALKVPSTPDDPSRAVLDAVRTIADNAAAEVCHGTTVATNAMLERKGARVAFVTTAGLEDTIAIGRQARANLYNWFAEEVPCLVPRELRFGVKERVAGDGAVLLHLKDAELYALVEAVGASGAEAVALSLLYSFVYPEHEERVARALSALGLPVSVSHRILPEFREYERGSTMVANAYVAPRMSRYLSRLEDGLAAVNAESSLQVMQSSGGIVSAGLAAKEPVRTLLSGPAGGVIGACRVAAMAGVERVIGIDMGGTSTDVFLAADAAGPRLTREAKIAGVPVSVPMLDIHTVGAGGGSIARWDAGGLLHVGPKSAGADPGPACFGRGDLPTVTDANMVLGRLDAGSFLGGAVGLDRARAERVLDRERGWLANAEELAAGIVRVVETHMERAIRVISVERGLDPREFTLVAFGGGGPLHACALARALRMRQVLVPPMPGALSAVGILLADTVRDSSRTVMLAGNALVRAVEVCFELETAARAELADEGMLDGVAWLTEASLDLRYRGQGYELNLPLDTARPQESPAAFHRLHARLYGFSDDQRPVEIVNVRLRMRAAGEQWRPRAMELIEEDGSQAFRGERMVWFEGGPVKTRIYERAALQAGAAIEGPAMITEYTSATLVPPGFHLTVDGLGNLRITVPSIEDAETMG